MVLGTGTPRLLASALAACAAASLFAQQNPQGLALPHTARVRDAVELPMPKQVALSGPLGERWAVNVKRLLAVDEGELLAGFRNRPGSQAWVGEHVGKWLHAASLVVASTGDKALRAKLVRVAHGLIATQEPDGYLGTYVPGKRFGLYPDADWDVWVHKYDVIGLLAYYQLTHDKAALVSARRVGDLLCRTFAPGRPSINGAGTHAGMAATSVLEPMVLLYRATGDGRYLTFAKRVVAAWDEPGGAGVLHTILKTGSLKKVGDAKAYEMLSNVVGLCEFYRVTGDAKLLTAAKMAWSDVVKNRLYITGTGSSREVWTEDGVLPDAQNDNVGEVCVTVTWMQLNAQLLRLTGDQKYANEIERTAYGHLMAAQRPDGQAWSYYTPLEGRKFPTTVTCCCLSSGPRGIALLPSLAYAVESQGVLVNLYGASNATLKVKGRTVKLLQKTEYPFGNTVALTVDPVGGPARFRIRLRKPEWGGATVRVNGSALHGNSWSIERTWKRGDAIRIDLAARPNLVKGTHNNAGFSAFRVGALVYAADVAHNPGLAPLKFLAFASDRVDRLHMKRTAGGRTIAVDGLYCRPGESVRRKVRIILVPFNVSGANGSPYKVWLSRPGTPLPDTSKSPVSAYGEESISRVGNQTGSFADDDPSTISVTFNDTADPEDCYAVKLPKPHLINRVVYCHGACYHDGGWFDTSAGKPKVQVQLTAGGPWVDVGVLEDYPATDARTAPTIADGQAFSLRFAAVKAVAIRVVGRPSCGDNPKQNFSSCGELQGFYDK